MSRGITLLHINIHTGLFLTVNKLKHNNSHVIKMYTRAYFTQCINYNGGHHGRDHMVVGFTTTYAISAYHH